MKYVYPKEYKGIKLNTKNNQLITKAMVDVYCLKCDLFMGQEHNFLNVRHLIKSKMRK